MNELKQLTKNDLLSWIKEFLNLDYTDEQIMADAYYLKLMEVYESGYKKCLSKWQEANRWRKVSEELPEVRDESYQILIRIPNIKSSATAWNIRNQSDYDIIAKMGNSEWKPIE